MEYWVKLKIKPSLVKFLNRNFGKIKSLGIWDCINLFEKLFLLKMLIF